MITTLFAAALLQSVNPHATELFERDPQLAAWAIRRFDRNGDGWLTQFEAEAALASFKQLADANKDGRVSVREFGAAKAAVAVNSDAQPVGTVARP